MSEWFFIKQKQNRVIESLQEHRVIYVKWNTDELSVDLPKTVYLPVEILVEIHSVRDLDRKICNYLSDKFGYTVSDWQVSNPSRVEL